MRLNRLEYALMNNPLRSAVQRYVEAKKLARLGGRLDGGRALELGCGRGVGIEIALREFGAASVDAFDLDPRMAAQAKRRLAGYEDRVNLWVGDARALSVAAEIYDAVFDFGIIHHVHAWREVVREVFRVLKPSGLFFGEEVLRAVIDHPLGRCLFDHPRLDRFDHYEFVQELETTGFEIVASRDFGGLIGQFVARKPVLPIGIGGLPDGADHYDDLRVRSGNLDDPSACDRSPGGRRSHRLLRSAGQ